MRFEIQGIITGLLLTILGAVLFLKAPGPASRYIGAACFLVNLAVVFVCSVSIIRQVR